MRKAIAVKLEDRPQLIEDQILSIATAQLQSNFDLLLLSCNSEKCLEFAKACAKLLLEADVIESQVVLQSSRARTSNILGYAVKDLGFDVVLYMADYVKLVPDSLRYVSWWSENSKSAKTSMGNLLNRYEEFKSPGLIIRSNQSCSSECFAIKTSGYQMPIDIPTIPRYISVGLEDHPPVQSENYEGDYWWTKFPIR